MAFPIERNASVDYWEQCNWVELATVSGGGMFLQQGFPAPTAVELRMKSLSGRQSLARALARNLTLPKELEITIKSKSKSKRQATVLNSTTVGHRRGECLIPTEMSSSAEASDYE